VWCEISNDVYVSRRCDKRVTIFLTFTLESLLISLTFTSTMCLRTQMRPTHVFDKTVAGIFCFAFNSRSPFHGEGGGRKEI
jgi:hypothetical protein